MIKILFICHGNICRSPMAEFVMKDMVEKIGAGDDFHIASAATSTEEIGNPVHPGTLQPSCRGDQYSGKVCPADDEEDYREYGLSDRHGSVESAEYGEDHWPDREGKLSFCWIIPTKPEDEIADPLVSLVILEETYRDITEGCSALLEKLGY